MGNVARETAATECLTMSGGVLFALRLQFTTLHFVSQEFTLDAMSSAIIIGAVVADLRQHAPFSEIPAEQLERFARALSVRYVAAGKIVLPLSAERVSHVFIVKTGRIHGERPGLNGAQVGALEVAPGEMFPIGAVLTERAPQSTFRAAEDSLLYVVPAAVFTEALKELPALQDFCERRLFNLLERSRSALRAAYSAESLSEHPFSKPLSSAIKRQPITCSMAATIGEALAAMYREKIGAMVVVDSHFCPAGILTERDVLGRVTLPQVPLSENVMRVASQPVETLDARSPISAAALLMVTKNFRHVVVTDAGKVVGVVSERSLFALQRQSLSGISDAIRTAQNVEALVQCGHDIRELSRLLVAQGVAAGLLTQFISQLNDQLTQRLLYLLSEAHPITQDETLRWCWLAFGSEGRHEQTISTDQDNGLVYTCGAKQAHFEQDLLKFAGEINAALARCGYPLCKGNIMASNPALCLSVEAWQEKFTHWIDAGDPQSLLNANIFFDIRALYGDASLVERIVDKVWPLAKANVRFGKQMAENTLTNRPPLNWLGNIEGGTVDLKRAGAMPFSDSARLLALAHGVRATSTRERLRALGPLLRVSDEEVNSWVEAFEFIQMLRLRHQHERLNAVQQGRAVSDNPNEISVSALSNLDVRILREAFRQARKLQQRVELDYA
jgi:CBS domain-containing protein